MQLSIFVGCPPPDGSFLLSIQLSVVNPWCCQHRGAHTPTRCGWLCLCLLCLQATTPAEVCSCLLTDGRWGLRAWAGCRCTWPMCGATARTSSALRTGGETDSSRQCRRRNAPGSLTAAHSAHMQRRLDPVEHPAHMAMAAESWTQQACVLLTVWTSSCLLSDSSPPS